MLIKLFWPLPLLLVMYFNSPSCRLAGILHKLPRCTFLYIKCLDLLQNVFTNTAAQASCGVTSELPSGCSHERALEIGVCSSAALFHSPSTPALTSVFAQTCGVSQRGGQDRSAPRAPAQPATAALARALLLCRPSSVNFFTNR